MFDPFPESLPETLRYVTDAARAVDEEPNGRPDIVELELELPALGGETRLDDAAQEPAPKPGHEERDESILAGLELAGAHRDEVEQVGLPPLLRCPSHEHPRKREIPGRPLGRPGTRETGYALDFAFWIGILMST